MTIDKYTKFLLTLIAVGIIGINFHLFKGSIVKDALAATGDWQVVKIDDNNYNVFSDGGKYFCKAYTPWKSKEKRDFLEMTYDGGWHKTGC